jgi:hypothetical protein
MSVRHHEASVRAMALAIGVALLLAGCAAVNVRQLESVRRTLPQTDERLAAAAPYAWDLRFAGMVFTVYPATPGADRVIFANPEGLRVYWDGRAVYRVEGLPGALGLLQSGIEGEERWFARDGGPTVRLRCTPRRDWRLSATQQGWRVECRGEAEGRKISATQVAEFGADGGLRRIEATVIPGVPPLVLERRWK